MLQSTQEYHPNIHILCASNFLVCCRQESEYPEVELHGWLCHYNWWYRSEISLLYLWCEHNLCLLNWRHRYQRIRNEETLVYHFFKTFWAICNFTWNPQSSITLTIKSYKILQKLSPKHAAHGVAQSTYPIYRHGKACLSKQPPWRAAVDPRLARDRSRVRAPGAAALFSSTLPSFLLWEIVFSHLPRQPRKSVRVNKFYMD